MKPFRLLPLAGLALVALLAIPAVAMAAPDVRAVSQDAVLGATTDAADLDTATMVAPVAVEKNEQRAATPTLAPRMSAASSQLARTCKPPRLSRGDPLLDVGRSPST